MTDVVVLGFPRSTFVHIARFVLTHKGVRYTFRDLEPEMGSAAHLALHPFNRVPILQHGDFTLYETSAIVGGIPSGAKQSEVVAAFVKFLRSPTAVAAIKAKGMQAE